MADRHETDADASAALARLVFAPPPHGDNPPGAVLKTEGRRVSVSIANVPKRPSASPGAAPARFRDDKVARRALADLEAAIEERGPDGRTAILTLGAPIRLAGKTVEALTDLLLDRLGGGLSGSDETAEILGNRARFRIVSRRPVWTSKLVGFVFTGDPAPEELANAMADLRDAVMGHGDPRESGDADGRWLVLTGAEWIADAKAYRRAFARLSAPHPFEKILMAYGRRFETLFDRDAP